MFHTDFIVTEEAKLEYRRWEGTAQKLPIVLLHEALGSAALWREFPSRLVERTGRTVVAWSREGHGKSSPMPRTSGFDYLHREADLLPAVLMALKYESAHLFGHSDGSTIALLAASRFPQQIASLILEAPHVIVEDVMLQGIASTQRMYAEGSLRTKLQRHHLDPDPIFDRWVEVWLAPQYRNWSIVESLSKIRAPTLSIQGHDDAYASLRQIELISAALPTSDYIELRSCGHVPHAEQSEAVLSAAASFLDGLA